MTNEDKQYLLDNRCKNDFERDNLNDLFKFLDDNGIEYQLLRIPIGIEEIVNYATGRQFPSAEEERMLRDRVAEMYNDVTYDIDIYIPEFRWGFNVEGCTLQEPLLDWAKHHRPRVITSLDGAMMFGNLIEALEWYIRAFCVSGRGFEIGEEEICFKNRGFEIEEVEGEKWVSGFHMERTPFYGRCLPHIVIKRPRGEGDPCYYWADYYNSPEFREVILQKKKSLN